MDVERSMLSAAIASSEILELVARGITPELFSGTPAGQECSDVYRFCIDYERNYLQTPSISAIQRVFPEWHGEFSPDPIPALADEFLDAVRKRYYDAAVVKLSREFNGREHWRRLDEIMLDAAREMAAVLPSGRVARFSSDMEKRIEQYEIEANKGYRPGIRLGIPIIDDVTDGVRTGWLVTTAGFSGLGKTTLALFGLLSAFEQDKQCLMLSLEMSAAEVMERLDTMVNNFPHKDLVRRQLEASKIERWKGITRIYTKAAGEIVVIDKLGGCTLDRVHAEISRYRPQIVAIDYVQRMSGTRSSMAKWEGLEEITNGLKTIAMDTDTAVMMVSQDGRSSSDSGSTATNAGGSISVYQAADIYLGLMQDDEMRGMQKMRVKMLKNRHGDRAEVDMLWRPSHGTFDKWENPMEFMKQPA